MPVKDIGNGQVLADFTGGNPAEELKSVMGLVDLANRIRMAPTEQKLKEAELKLKDNQVLMIDIANETERAKRVKALNDAALSNAEVFLKTIESVPALLNQDPELANQFLARMGGAAKKNEDGSFNVAMATRDGIKSFRMDPNRVLDPKERKSAVEGYRKEYAQSAKDYQTVYENFQSMNELSKLGTGAADIGIIFAYNKILDPGSRVAQGEVLTAENAPKLADQWRNKYNKALTDGGPIFGPVGWSSNRSDFVNGAKAIYESKRSTTERTARFFSDVAANALGVPVDNPEVRGVVQPFGDITWESLYGPKKETGGQDVAGTESRTAPPASSQAGPIPTGDAPQGKVPERAKFKSTNDLLRNNLFKTLSPPGRRP